MGAQVINIADARGRRKGPRMSTTLARPRRYVTELAPLSPPPRHVVMQGRVVRATEGNCALCGCDLAALDAWFTCFLGDGPAVRSCTGCGPAWQEAP